MSKPSRSARPLPSHVHSKPPMNRKEDFSNRGRKISLGEKILRAGSEENLSKQQVQAAQILSRQVSSSSNKGQSKHGMQGSSLENIEFHQSKENLSNGNSHIPQKSGRNIPRRHTVGGPRSSKEILGMQTSDMDRKREAFLEHLKYKYPHHATAIMGHQERLRDQAVQCMLASLHSELDIQRYLMKIESSQRTKSPKLSSSPQPSLGDPGEHLSEASADSGDMMFEADSAVPFVRGSRTRASLPVVRSNNQTKERSLGVLFLQYGDDTKKMQMPNEITGIDTIRALFVSAFAQQLTMKILESPNTAIYIKDDGRNIYYELSDVRNIQDRAFLKVYNKDPAHAFNHTRGTLNGDVRMQRDISYSVREGTVIHRPGSATYTSHAGPVSPPPTPVPHSMPSSPSRIPYGGGRPAAVQSNTTMQRERIPSVPASRSISPSPSAILERRDVKPDEDMGNKNVQLLRNDMYQDPYLYHEGRMSMASSHGGHPLDVPDHIIAYHRGSTRSASTYSNSSMQMEMMEQSMYRQKSRKHVESHLPTLGSKTPPTSPHRVADIRMMEMHAHNAHLPPHGMQSDRSSPLRQSFKKEQGPGMFVEAKVRNTGGIISMADIVQSPTDKQVFGGYGVPPKDPYTRERMHAMEKQIASLTGIVQTALLKGPSPNNSAPSDKVLKSANGSTSSTDRPGNQGAAAAKNSLVLSESVTLINQQSAACSQDMHVSLQDMRRNVAELRLQLHKMRQLQLQNQETVRLMMKKAEMEISSKVNEMVRSAEDPVQRQRVLVEQERQKYLNDEEQIVAKLSDLEDFVESLKKERSTSQRVITLKDVEDRAFILRQIGESVSNLKGEFPYLQNKMRAVLRVEVEAVRFLKEEPHKLDSLLKRIRNMTDALSALRRHATDGPSKATDINQTSHFVVTERVTETDSLQVHEEKSQTYLQPTQTDGGPAVESPTASVKSEVVPLSAGLKVHQVQSSPVLMQQSQHSSALVNHTPTPSTQTSHTTELLVSPQTASVPPSVTPENARRNPTTQTTGQEGSSMQSLFIDEINQVTYRNRAVSIEEAERKFEEKRQNLDHYNGKEFEKMLEEAQANIMKAIPSLEVPAQPQKVEIVDKLEVTEVNTKTEQDNDKIKSPPPPPPRRMFPPGSGLNSVRTAESTYLVRRESSKDSEEAPPKVPAKAETEDLHSLEATVKSSVIKDEDDEEEGARIMAELQVSCTVSKECLNSESPEEKWKIQNVLIPASDSTMIRQGDTIIVNEKSTYSLFTGREKCRESQTDKEISPDKECEKEDMSPLVIPGILEKRTIKFNALKESESGKPQHKTEVLNVKVGDILHEEKEKVVESHLSTLKPLNEQEMPYMDVGQTVVLRNKSSRRSLSQQQSEETDSPTTSPTEAKSPADNIAFMITKTKVQVLSTGEVQDIVNRRGEDVQTFNIDRGNNEKILSGNLVNVGSEDPMVCTDKKPVIIIFDEPMDIKSAYKRLSTIFEEGDDDLEKHMSQAKIEEEEEEETEVSPSQESKQKLPMEHTIKVSAEGPGLENKYRFNYPSLAEMKKTIFEDANATQTHFTDDDKSEACDDQFGQRQDVKKKFKFKFPKKQLAALTQAIRTGTKTGKKTLQVVVYEEEEEPDGTIKQHKEAKRFEIVRSNSKEENAKSSSEAEAGSLETDIQVSRTDEIKRTTYKILDSLEQTIKQQETLMSEMAPIMRTEVLETREKVSSDIKTGAVEPAEETKPVLSTPSSIPTAARKGSNGGPQTSRMPIPMSSKSRQANVDKTSKQPKLQEPQRQYRQANGGTKKAGGDVKASTPSLSVSKIPGFSSNTGKSGSVPAQSSDTSNPPNPPVKSHVSVAHSNIQASRTINSSALIRPAHNGSSKLQPPPTYKGHHLSFSPQASNGRPALPSPTASSSSPPSSVSPSSLTQGVKSVRTIHTPSFTSYKSQNGNASKGLNAKETS
ncbi:sickle tail protein homolog isoform X4 [Xenopus laevis]|uniref:Sickle tail protein homolog isoform X4 n=1 Tax=Xenopus laevis TaxID=8355 RepID=A0A8J1L1D4_XENLA|nr:sickle tail protein homolog isoform X4 [Xenopus laevis]